MVHASASNNQKNLLCCHCTDKKWKPSEHLQVKHKEKEKLVHLKSHQAKRESQITSCQVSFQIFFSFHFSFPFNFWVHESWNEWIRSTLFFRCFVFSEMVSNTAQTAAVSEDLPPASPRIRLADGRYLAYRESGVPKNKANYKIIIVHGFGSSKEMSFLAPQVSLFSQPSSYFALKL